MMENRKRTLHIVSKVLIALISGLSQVGKVEWK